MPKERNDLVQKGLDLRTAQKAWHKRNTTGRWKNDAEKKEALLHCKKLEREFDDLLLDYVQNPLKQLTLPLS